MLVRFVTGNEGKAREAQEYLDGITAVERVEYDYTEIQSDSLEEIATRGARESFEELSGTEPVLVGDTGMFVDTLGGFPGPYSAYVEDTVGVERLWRLASEEDDHRARFRTVLGYADADRTETFEGELVGTLVPPRGDGGFGYDPIFEYNGQTLAEMDVEEKNAISHRGRALATFADWYADCE
ncbi:RdgB/HAM1 family non-canonical purine NTP pyrophosphatase [Natronobacterium gregoryi]|uniref:Non-canonical purine NTP pyrophosphatase, RdgB/HAM1 family n=2 Tax=Natronobacterium gregoryi TaxID=44930 RepID=L0AJC4_NATGS|nr:RdgB/HAM1 family non-canonical purine NTP pyrophosphatase [Natronobacterium gregoryi]AFZ73549.1 non-canonical purine NTP pyrophosphatase, RdgB/HAM1 family [Natronobacterium gregoryi SP2]ELY68217.1 RdgB/HAM1 family non-canonical purine NTP pyrophosphatase [Natronobacterium gregoryi SP2]PLK20550.1 non-canonical purine NTP pyrophosphatase, RdgB/HAM1 family [Natronobacterium gregoryi SP2]SFJ17391.1 XTP/dITP diphosphohydrolase [Natronobacterium gregoryi]